MKFLIILFLVTYSLIPIYAETTLTLASGEWEPYVSSKYENFGVASYIITESFKLEKINVKYVFAPWNRSIYTAKIGIYDGSIIYSKTKERQKKFYFNKTPIIKGDNVFFHKKNFKFKWHKNSDLKNFRIGTTLGYIYGKHYKKIVEKYNLKTINAYSDSENFKNLINDKIDLFLCDKQTGLTLIKKYFSKEDKIKITYNKKKFSTLKYYILLTKKKKMNKHYIKIFNKGFDKLKKTGKYKQIMENFKNGEYR